MYDWDQLVSVSVSNWYQKLLSIWFARVSFNIASPLMCVVMMGLFRQMIIIGHTYNYWIYETISTEDRNRKMAFNRCWKHATYIISLPGKVDLPYDFLNNSLGWNFNQFILPIDFFLINWFNMYYISWLLFIFKDIIVIYYVQFVEIKCNIICLKNYYH